MLIYSYEMKKLTRGKEMLTLPKDVNLISSLFQLLGCFKESIW